MKKWYIVTGYVTLIISCFLWLMIVIVPFLGYSKKETAGFITILIITGEITFYLGILLLGKTIYAKIKSRLSFWKKKTDDGRPKTGDGSEPLSFELKEPPPIFVPFGNIG